MGENLSIPFFIQVIIRYLPINKKAPPTPPFKLVCNVDSLL